MIVIPSTARDLGVCLRIDGGGGASKSKVPRCSRDNRLLTTSMLIISRDSTRKKDKRYGE
jgi:hypothetical protein